MINEIVILAIAGALGALISDIIQDNTLTLPEKIDNTIILGSLGGVIIGAVAGYIIDGSFLTAFLAGYTGKEVIENLIGKTKTKEKKEEQTIEDIISYTAKEEGVDPDLAIRVAKCESGLDTKAININTDGSKDRGLFQINDKWHPEVSDEQAFDPVYSTKFFCKAFKEGHLDWWKATKNCWEK